MTTMGENYQLGNLCWILRRNRGEVEKRSRDKKKEVRMSTGLRAQASAQVGGEWNPDSGR